MHYITQVKKIKDIHILHEREVPPVNPTSFMNIPDKPAYREVYHEHYISHDHSTL